MKRKPAAPALAFHPASPERWNDIEALFGPRGACAGCWCMWWRRARSEFQKNAGDGNRRAFRKLIDGGAVPGILAYAEGKPVGWCAVEPKSAYPSLERSRTKRVDDRPCWSVSCFFVDKAWRKQGVTAALLDAAIDRARRLGADLIEGYPIDTSGSKGGDVMAFSSFMGTAQVFRRAGFAVVARPSAAHPVMRLELAKKPRKLRKL